MNEKSEKKVVHVIGGSTRFIIDAHQAIVATGKDDAPARGGTAKRIAALLREMDEAHDVRLHLTKEADSGSWIDTNDHMKQLVLDIVDDPASKIVFFNPAIVDFSAILDLQTGSGTGRIRTKNHEGEVIAGIPATLVPMPKLIPLFRQGGEGREPRKDIFLVGFKATAGAPPDEQYRQGLDLLKRVSANLVLANDTVTGLNMVVVPEEGAYHATTDRHEALRGLVDMTLLRSKLTFTASTVVEGRPVDWNSELVPASLRTVINHCIARGAYKPVRGVTAGHFAIKIDGRTFLTSRRKTDFNKMEQVGLVKVTTSGPDSVIAEGSKPSVGGQSQRIVFAEHPDLDSIVHFHCEKRPGSLVPTVSQREYECGSHECGANTSRGLRRFGDIAAVFLDRHGPNIVFNRSVDPQKVIDFIEANFDLSTKTGGFAVA